VTTTTKIVVFKEDGVVELVTDGAGVCTRVVNCSGAVGEKGLNGSRDSFCLMDGSIQCRYRRGTGVMATVGCNTVDGCCAGLVVEVVEVLGGTVGFKDDDVWVIVLWVGRRPFWTILW
jgi:hypothetical protein